MSVSSKAEALVVRCEPTCSIKFARHILLAPSPKLIQTMQIKVRGVTEIIPTSRVTLRRYSRCHFMFYKKGERGALTNLHIKMTVFWDVVWCSLIPTFQRCLLPPSSGLLINFHQTTTCNIPEDSHLQTRRCENLKFHQIFIYVLRCLPQKISRPYTKRHLCHSQLQIQVAIMMVLLINSNEGIK
jgi:hypothetical protein